MKKILITAILSTLAMNASAQDNAQSDFYVEGFEAWAQELKKMGDDISAHATEAYVKDASGVIKKQGYIGAELPLPKATKVADGVYTIVGSQIWHNPSNFGLNNNISFIIFKDGVFVFNAGANPAIAYSAHQQIKRITNKPVKWLAVENNQGHAYLGASYWVDVGVKNLYSSAEANDVFDRAFDREYQEWGERVGKILTHSARNVTDKFTTFEGKMTVNVGGGETFELIDFGPGHTPASTSVYVPSRKLFLSGDLTFNERMPVMFNYTNSFDWMNSFEKMMKIIPADSKVIPGHGTPTDMQTVKKQTYDYFRYLQKEIKQIVENGGTVEEAEAVDQSKYKDRPVFEQAAKNNAREIYKEIQNGYF
ncbi:MBL fold metallo-hydrolase [Thiomicrorhabdus sp. Milos-T2]|uniref:MBL fold metallo-hydrolase n=1 Tax=Thiomicrorhabdus sp. Milos-T2 TaxID=90814 RepID=UPI000493F8A3|nr:MBL fold metallo-hydrolase [Thiomicrorhabdus sp. Milos-T2]